MLRSVFVVVGCGALVFATIASEAADVRIAPGTKVLPKEGCVIKGTTEAVDEKKFGMPYVVEKVEGDKVWIRGAKKGWVRRSQVMTVDAALAYYDKLIDVRPNNAWALHLRGVVRMEKGELDAAIVDFGAALKLKPESEIYGRRASAWGLKAEYDKALEDFDEAIRLEPENVSAHIGRGFAWSFKRDFEKAVEDYNRAIELEPHNGAAHLYRGDTWFAKQEYDKAIGDYNEAVRLTPNPIDAYFHRGLARFTKQEFDKAIDDYGAAIQIDPKVAILYNNRGLAWAAKGEYAKAIDSYNEAIRLDPNETFAYGNRGNAWLQKKEYAKAIDDYEQALRLAPNDTRNHTNRAQVAAVVKDYEKAVASYTESLRLDPKNALSANNLSWLLATCKIEKVRDGKRAVELGTQACELTGWKDANCLGTLAGAYAEAGDFEKAIEYEQKAIDLNPKDAAYVTPAKGRLKLYQEGKPFRE